MKVGQVHGIRLKRGEITSLHAYWYAELFEIRLCIDCHWKKISFIHVHGKYNFIFVVTAINPHGQHVNLS